MFRAYLFLFLFFICEAALAGEDQPKKSCADNVTELAHSKILKSIAKMLQEISDPELYRSFDQYPEVQDSAAEALEEKRNLIGILLGIARKQSIFSAQIIEGLIATFEKIEPELQETLVHQLESFYVSLYQQNKSPEVLSSIVSFDRNLSAILKMKLQLLENRIKREVQSISSAGDLRKIRLSQLLEHFHTSDPSVLSSIEVMAIVMATEKNSAHTFGPQIEVDVDGETGYRAYQSLLRRAVSAENFSTDTELVGLASLYASLLLSYYQAQNDVSRDSQMNEDFRLQASQWIEDYRWFYEDLKEKEKQRLVRVSSQTTALKDSPVMVERYLVDALSRGDEKTLFSIIAARDQNLQASLFRYVAEMARRNGRLELAERFEAAGKEKGSTVSLHKALATQRGFPGRFSKEKTIEAFLLLSEDDRLDLLYRFSNRRFSPVDYIDFITELANHSGQENYWIRLQVFNYLLEAAKPIEPGESATRMYYRNGAKQWKIRRTPEVMAKALQNLRLFDEELFAGMETSLADKIAVLSEHLKKSDEVSVELGYSVNPFEAVLTLLHLVELESSPRYFRHYLNDRLRLFSVSWNLSLFEQNAEIIGELTAHLPLPAGSERSARPKVLAQNAEDKFKARVNWFLRLPARSSKLSSELHFISQTLRQELVPSISILFKLKTGIQKMLEGSFVEETYRVALYRLIEDIDYALKNSLLYAVKRFESSERREHGAGREVLRAGLVHQETSVFSANLILDLAASDKPLEMRVKALEQIRKFREDFNEKLESGKLLQSKEFMKAKEILDEYYFAHFRLFKEFLTQKIIMSNKKVAGRIAAKELGYILDLSETKNPAAKDLLSIEEAKKVFDTLQLLKVQQVGSDLIPYGNFKWPEKVDDIFEQELRAHFSALKRYIEYLYAYEDDGAIRWYAMEFRRLFDLN